MVIDVAFDTTEVDTLPSDVCVLTRDDEIFVVEDDTLPNDVLVSESDEDS